MAVTHRILKLCLQASLRGNKDEIRESFELLMYHDAKRELADVFPSMTNTEKIFFHQLWSTLQRSVKICAEHLQATAASSEEIYRQQMTEADMQLVFFANWFQAALTKKTSPISQSSQQSAPKETALRTVSFPRPTYVPILNDKDLHLSDKTTSVSESIQNYKFGMALPSTGVHGTPNGKADETDSAEEDKDRPNTRKRTRGALNWRIGDKSKRTPVISVSD